MDELIKAMSDSDLSELKTKYANNPSVATLIDGILETRQAEATEVKAKAEFTKGIAKLFSKLPHPEDVHNVYVRWGEVDVEDGEPEEVEVTAEDGSKSMETRVPSHKEYQWIVTVNHVVKMSAGSGGSDGSPKPSKRAITVYKRNGTQLELKGHYTSASKACEALGLTIGGDSATRVLARDGFIAEPYEGVDTAS